MDFERWNLVERIYHSVLACPPESRAAVLGASCGSDPVLLEELESLLSARDEAGDFLSSGELREYLDDLADPPEPPLIGRTLDHYEVIGEIGSGAMGIVYRARDTRLDRQVALKLLRTRCTHDAERVARFRREAKAASTLNHPNIVTIYEIGQDGEKCFMAAELIDGVSLRQHLSTRRLSRQEVLDIAVQCAAALQAAHRSGVVHCDIKPENIMIRPDGGVKVVDFGLASINENGEQPALQLSVIGAVMGTPRYMSPEQARGQRLDARTDIFSLGAVIYEMAMNQPAFPGANAAEVFTAILGQADPVARGTPFGRPLDRVIRKSLARDREARYQTAKELADDLQNISTGAGASRAKLYAASGLVGLLAVAATMLFWFRPTRRQPPLNERDTILLTDFRNLTGEPVFELTLREGLAEQLEQSPFLNILPDARVRDTLRRMRRQPGEPITPEIGREISLRQGLRAMITGSIAPLGKHYVLTLEAVDSQNSETLARTQTEAQSKEDVLNSLSRAAAQLRERLGESLVSVQKYDALLDRTTSSLEALQAYSLGYKERRQGHTREAIRFWLKALELDPAFAGAYADLAVAYRNSRHTSTAAQYAAKAYALRDRVSERERLRITSLYYEYVTGEVDKNIETLKLFQQIYPRDALPHNNVSTSYAALAQYERALKEAQAAMLLDSNEATRFSTQASYLMHLNRLKEAKDICEKAVREKRDSTSVHRHLYWLAFLAGDKTAMERQLAWASSKADEDEEFHWQAATAAYQGEWRSSGEFMRRAINIAQRKGDSEMVALYTSELASRAAILERCGEARSAANRTLSMEGTQQSQMLAGLALELCGDTRVPQPLELATRYPKDQIALSVRLPLLRAAADLRQSNAMSAITALEPVRAYEGAAEFWPQFLRGQAYLRQGNGPDSAREFNSILDHRGQGPDSLIYPLAHLGAARAAALAGDPATARRFYQVFFTEWKEADADLPPLLAARKEFMRLL